MIMKDERTDDVINVENIVGHTGGYFMIRACLSNFLETTGIAEDFSPGEIAQALSDEAAEYQAAWEQWIDENFDEEDCTEGCCQEPVDEEE